MSTSLGSRLKQARAKPILALIIAVGIFVGMMISGATANADDNLDKPDPSGPIMMKGKTTASYFWDDGSGRQGDTGMPASGEPMQRGMAASPSWPLGTKGYVIYEGKKAPFFVGDRGPGDPSGEGIMLDLDGKTFAKLTGGEFNMDTLTIDGNGGMGHIDIKYVVTEWGDGPGKKGAPQNFDSGWWDRTDKSPIEPVRTKKEAKQLEAEREGADLRAARGSQRGEEESGQAKSGNQPSSDKQSAEEPGATAASTDAEPAADASSPIGGIVLVGLVVVGGVSYLLYERKRRNADD